MKIYNSQSPHYSNRQLINTAQTGFLKVFSIRDNFFVQLVNGLFYILLGSVALPLRVITRSNIGERSIRLIHYMGAMALLFSLALYGINGFDKVTGEVFSLSITDSTTVREVYPFRTFVSGSTTLGKYRQLCQQQEEQYPESISNPDWKYFRDWQTYPKRGDAEHEVFYFRPIYFSGIKLRYPALQLPLVIVIVYLYLFFIRDLYVKAQFSYRRRNKIKWHSYDRGRGILQWLSNFNVEQTRIWVLESLFFIILSVVIVFAASNITLRFLFALILVQAIAMFIEDWQIAKRKRDVIFDMVDAELDSRMIQAERQKFLSKGKSSVSTPSVVLQDVIIS